MKAKGYGTCCWYGRRRNDKGKFHLLFLLLSKSFKDVTKREKPRMDFREVEKRHEVTAEAETHTLKYMRLPDSLAALMTG